MVRTFLYSIWLPIAILLISAIRLMYLASTAHHPGVAEFFDATGVTLLVIMTWPCGVPLTIALRKLYKRNRIATYVLGVILVPLSAVFALFGGLFGPFGVAAYAIIASLPAWIVLGILTLIQHRREQRRNLPI